MTVSQTRPGEESDGDGGDGGGGDDELGCDDHNIQSSVSHLSSR